MKLQTIRIVRRSYNKICERKYCWILSEWKLSIFVKRGALDKAWASSQINETDISLLTWLIYHDDRTDTGYQPK